MRINRAFILGIVSIACATLPGTLKAEGMTMLTLAPHCAEAADTSCTGFPVKNAEFLTTGKLSVGDILDIDVVLTTDTPASVESIRAWLSYDSTVLEARSVEVTNVITAPTPGEQNIDPIMRLIKIGGSTNGTLTKQKTAVARVTFRVTSATQDTVISFHDFQVEGTGHTAINGKPTGLRAQEKGLDLPCIDKLIGCRGTTTALLTVKPSSLVVALADTSSALAGSVATDTATASTTNGAEMEANQKTISDSIGISIPNALADQNVPQENMNSNVATEATTQQGPSSFSLLQVQNVRVTSKERDIFLGWQALKSSVLKGYNVYYGTVSGRYIQRKTIPGSSTSLVLRDLEPGTTYFLAIRALNDKDIESAFSQEVSITVGKPESSSAPLDAPPEGETEVDGNPIENHDGTKIVGDTGVNSGLSLLLIISAIIGTGFAVNRQILIRR